jgi:hypothetical protein
MLKHVCTQKYGDVVEQYFEHDLYGDCLLILTMSEGSIGYRHINTLPLS